MLVADARDQFLKMHRAHSSYSTEKAYRERIKTFVEGFGERLVEICDMPDGLSLESWRRLQVGYGKVDVAAVTPADIDDWILVQRNQHTLIFGVTERRERRGLSPATLQGRKQAIRRFFAFCERRGWTALNPAEHIKKDRFSKRNGTRPKAMRMYDFFKMLEVAAAKHGEGYRRDLAILMLMADSGARPGEICSLNIDGLNLEELEATVEGKTGRRQIVFSRHTAQALQEWLPLRELVLACSPPPADTDALFVGMWPPSLGQRLRPDTIKQLFKRLATTAGLNGGACNPYAVRHMVATHLAANAPIHIVQDILGHGDISTTQIYLHTDLSELKGAVALHSVLNEFYRDKGK